MCGFVGLMCAIIAQGAMVRDGGTEVAKTYSVEETKTYSAARERAAETTTQQAKDSDTADKGKEAGTNEEKCSYKDVPMAMDTIASGLLTAPYVERICSEKSCSGCEQAIKDAMKMLDDYFLD